MTKKINFDFIGKHSFKTRVGPVPAKSIIPKWYKNMPQYESEKIDIVDGAVNGTVKKCVPTLDAITAGYLALLWSDVLISQTVDGPLIKWKTSSPVFGLHGNMSRDIPPPPGYSNIVFKFFSRMRIKTPPGYSTIVISPMGNNDSIFRALPAIIDTDKNIVDLSFPVWIKNDFDGVVEKGTPMVQLIPFKRESWISNFSYIEQEDFDIEADKGFNSIIKNNYIKNIWSRKEFN